MPDDILICTRCGFDVLRQNPIIAELMFLNVRHLEADLNYDL
jgi:hypothetical protein